MQDIPKDKEFKISRALKTTTALTDLLDYYKECFALLDVIHFNSGVTRQEYEKKLGDMAGIILPITHCGIKDNRTIKSFSQVGLKVGFIGNSTAYKGLPVLLNTVKDLNIDVIVWGGKKGNRSRIHFKGKFQKEELPSVYNGMDVLVVPSICKETFSLVTLEAISYGTPAIVSDTVGAQDIVKEYNPEFIYHTEAELKSLLTELVDNKSKLISFNKMILEKPWTHDIKDHAKDIIEKLYKAKL